MPKQTLKKTRTEAGRREVYIRNKAICLQLLNDSIDIKINL